jgi:hypothetical protein
VPRVRGLWIEVLKDPVLRRLVLRLPDEDWEAAKRVIVGFSSVSAPDELLGFVREWRSSADAELFCGVRALELLVDAAQGRDPLADAFIVGVLPAERVALIILELRAPDAGEDLGEAEEEAFKAEMRSSAVPRTLATPTAFPNFVRAAGYCSGAMSLKRRRREEGEEEEEDEEGSTTLVGGVGRDPMICVFEGREYSDSPA